MTAMKVLGVFAVFQMRTINAAAHDIQTSRLPSVRWLGEMRTQASRHRSNLCDHMLTTDARIKQDTDKLLESRMSDFSRAVKLWIAGLQSATETTVGAIREIGKTIASISETSSTIAAAVEEQGTVTKEIARNMQEAPPGSPPRSPPTSPTAARARARPAPPRPRCWPRRSRCRRKAISCGSQSTGS